MFNGIAAYRLTKPRQHHPRSFLHLHHPVLARPHSFSPIRALDGAQGIISLQDQACLIALDSFLSFIATPSEDIVAVSLLSDGGVSSGSLPIKSTDHQRHHPLHHHRSSCMQVLLHMRHHDDTLTPRSYIRRMCFGRFAQGSGWLKLVYSSPLSHSLF